MKRTLKSAVISAILLSLVAFFTVSAQVGTAQKDLYYNQIKITVNANTIIPLDANGSFAEPFIIDGTTYLPVRAVASVLGLKVGWDGKTSTVMLTSDENAKASANPDVSVSYTTRTVKKNISFNNIKISLDGKEFHPTDASGKYTEPFIIDGTTYLPVRAVAGMLGLAVDWDKDTGTVILMQKCPVCSSTEHTNHDDKVAYTLVDGVLTITGKGSTRVLTTRKYDSDGREIRVDALWFKKCESITEVIVSPGITDVYKDLFFGCVNLTKVTLPESLEAIGENAFYECSSLVQIDIPSGVTEIGMHAFGHCGLTEITIPDGVSKLNYGIVEYCKNLKTANIPASVKEIEFDVFEACDSLEAINVDKNNQYFCDVDGVLYTKDMKELRRYPTAKPQDTYTVPNGVSIIGMSSFTKNNLTHITLPDSVTEIQNYAFSPSLSLESIDMPATCSYIGMEAFAYSNKLKSIVIPDGVEVIGGGAFLSCYRLRIVEFPDSVREIGARAFQGCELKQIHIPENLEIIGAQAFSNCGELRDEISLPDSVTGIGDFAFSNNYYIPKFTIGKNVSYIGKGAFAECKKAELVLDKNNKHYTLDADGALFSADMTTLHWYPIKNGKTEYKIPSGVKVIDQAAFVSTPVSVIYLPKSIEEIRDAAFSTGCNVNVVQYEGTADEYNAIKWGEANNRPMDVYFMQNSGSCIVCGNTDHTEHTESMGVRWSIVDGVLMIGGYGDMSAYSVIDQAEQKVLPPEWTKRNAEVDIASVNGYVKDVCCMAFAGMTNLQSVKLCDGIETIVASAFADCTSLKQVVFPESVTFIGPAVFRNCTALEIFTFPTNTTVIPALMFQGCTSLKTVYIPESVSIIPENAFEGCTSLELVSFGGSQEQWERLMNSTNRDVFKNATIVCGSKIEVNKN